MRCKKCMNWQWDLVWPYATSEEGISLHLWQCTTCKHVVLASDQTAESEWVTV
jgi:hypothetical protein